MTPPLSNLAPLSRRAAVVALTVGGSEWNGGVLGADGCIYAVPCNASAVLKIDPRTNEVMLFGDCGSGQSKWRNGVLDPQSGAIFAAPFLVILIPLPWLCRCACRYSCRCQFVASCIVPVASPVATRIASRIRQSQYM